MTGFTDRKRFNFKSLHYDWEQWSVVWPQCTWGFFFTPQVNNNDLTWFLYLPFCPPPLTVSFFPDCHFFFTQSPLNIFSSAIHKTITQQKVINMWPYVKKETKNLYFFKVRPLFLVHICHLNSSSYNFPLSPHLFLNPWQKAQDFRENMGILGISTVIFEGETCYTLRLGVAYKWSTRVPL